MKGLIAVLLLIGVLAIVCGWFDDAWRCARRWFSRAPAAAGALKGGLKTAFGALKLAKAPWMAIAQLLALSAVVAAIAAYPLVLRGETRRAERAEDRLAGEVAATATEAASGELARDQMRRADAAASAAADGRRAAAQFRVELERNADEAGPIADLGRDRVRELRQRAALRNAAAVEDYRRRNPDRAAAAD